MPFRILAVLSLIVAFSSPTFAAGETQTWTVNGVERQELVFAPENAKTEPSPLIFAFHGHGGTSRNSAMRFKLQELWPEAIVIYPQGLKTAGQITDPEGLRTGWQRRAGDQEDRDLKLFDAALAWAKQTYKIDEKRIYCTGHSNGASFTYILWDARSDVFAAVAAACAPVGSMKGMKPKPVLHIGSPDDPLVLFEWQQKTIDALRKFNGCDPEGKPNGDRITVYSSATGTPVETYIYPGGHTPPPEAWPEVVKFFKQHPGK